MTKLLALVEHLVTERTVEVSLGAAATTYLATHSLSAVAVAVLSAVAASLGVSVAPQPPAAAPKG